MIPRVAIAGSSAAAEGGGATHGGLSRGASGPSLGVPSVQVLSTPRAVSPTSSFSQLPSFPSEPGGRRLVQGRCVGGVVSSRPSWPLRRVASTGATTRAECSTTPVWANAHSIGDSTRSVGYVASGNQQQQQQCFIDKQMEAMEERLGSQISKAQLQVDWLCETGLPMIEGKLGGLDPETLSDLSEKYRLLSDELQSQVSRTADVVESRVEKWWELKQADFADTIKCFENMLSETAADPRFVGIDAARISDSNFRTLSTRVEALERQTARRHVVASSVSSVMGASPESPRRAAAGISGLDDSPCGAASPLVAGEGSRICSDVEELMQRCRAMSAADNVLEMRANRTEECLTQLAVKVAELADIVHQKAVTGAQDNTSQRRTVHAPLQSQHDNEHTPTSGADVLVAVRHLDELSQVVQGLSDALERVVQDVAEERKASEVLRKAHETLEASVQSAGVATNIQGGGAVAYALRSVHDELADVKRNLGNLQAGIILIGAGLQRELPAALREGDLMTTLHRS